MKVHMIIEGLVMLLAIFFMLGDFAQRRFIADYVSDLKKDLERCIEGYLCSIEQELKIQRFVYGVETRIKGKSVSDGFVLRLEGYRPEHEGHFLICKVEVFVGNGMKDGRDIRQLFSFASISVYDTNGRCNSFQTPELTSRMEQLKVEVLKQLNPTNKTVA